MTASLKTIRFGVVPVEAWDRPADGSEPFRYVDISSVDRDAKAIVAPATLRVADAPSRARQVLKENDVLVSTVRPNLNAVALVPADLDGAIGSTGFTVLRANPQRVLSRFLFFWVRSPAFVAEMVKKATGASYPAVSDRIILESQMPVPTLDEQRHISEVLGRVDAVRRNNKAAVHLTDRLLRSAFLEMFGDPATNPERWNVVPLSSLGRITTGNTPSRAEPRYFGDDIEWIKSDNINTPGHYLTRAAEGLSKLGRAVARTAPAGSTLITCIAGTPECIGNVALSDREVAFNQQINAVTPHPEVDYRFLYVLLLVGKRLVQAASTNAMKGMVSKGKLEQVRVPHPPADMQRHFGRLFDRIIAMSAAHERACADADQLFGAVLSNVFSAGVRVARSA